MAQRLKLPVELGHLGVLRLDSCLEGGEPAVLFLAQRLEAMLKFDIGLLLRVQFGPERVVVAARPGALDPVEPLANPVQRRRKAALKFGDVGHRAPACPAPSHPRSAKGRPNRAGLRKT